MSKPKKKAEETELGPDFDEMWKETLKRFIVEGKLLERTSKL